MKRCGNLWRRAFGRALFISTTLTATPAAACSNLAMDDLVAGLPAAVRPGLHQQIGPIA